jgi:hypothetical protein
MRKFLAQHLLLLLWLLFQGLALGSFLEHTVSINHSISSTFIRNGYYRYNVTYQLSKQPNIGDFILCRLVACWTDSYTNNYNSPDLHITRNISFSFADDTNAALTDNLWTYSPKNIQINGIYVQVSRIPLEWSVSFAGSPSSDFMRICDADLDIDQEKELAFNFNSTLLISKLFTRAADSERSLYLLHLEMEKVLHSGDVLLVWIFGLSYGFFLNITTDFTFSPYLDNLSINYTSDNTFVLNFSISKLFTSSNSFDLSFPLDRVIYADFAGGKPENVVQNVRVFLIHSTDFSQTSNTDPSQFPLTEVLLGVFASLLLICISFLLLRRRCKSNSSYDRLIGREQGSISHASTIFPEDDSYTLHSNSTTTISTTY